MTSHPVWNKTTLSRKPCIPDIKLRWNAIRNSCSLFQNPTWKCACSAPRRRTDDDNISGGIKTSLFRKPCIEDKKLLWNAIRKSWSLFQKPSYKLAWSDSWRKKSRWRHIRLAIKPRYLGNHASRIKIYYGTLSGSHSRSFRISYENVRAAPLGGVQTMTSYPVGNKTSLTRKTCIANKKLLWNAIRRSRSRFQNCS